MPSPAFRRWLERPVGTALVVQLSAALAAVVWMQPTPGSPVLARRTASAHLVQPRPAARIPAHVDAGARLFAVRRLLAARADAVLRQDRAAFLATVDPAGPDFLARQGRYLDGLRNVPLASWEYELEAGRERAHTAALDARRGTWWAPNVTLRYALAGFDQAPTLQPQGLTFVERDGRWLVAADDDFAAAGHATTRDLWDDGRVLAARGASCLVLSHPQQAALVRLLVAECDAAVPRVSAVWGRDWAQRVVVLVPDSLAELTRLVPGAGDLTSIAALAAAELVEPTSGYHPVGDRILINPVTFRQLGPLGRRVVMDHEVTHVATRAATGPRVPTWLVEGIADYIGYLGARVPVAVAADELRSAVRAGNLPVALPLDSDFQAGRSDLAQAYEQSWLAVALLARRYGQPALLRLYREVGADPAPGALDRAMGKVLDSSVAEFTQAWRSDLQRRLS